MKKILFAALAALAITSCSQNEIDGIDNEKDAALIQRIDAINQRLVDCKTEGGLRNPMQLASEIRENREHSNIDFQDEYTQC